MNYKKWKGKTVKNLTNIPEKEFINFLVEDLHYSPKWRFLFLTLSKKKNYTLVNHVNFINNTETNYSCTNVLVAYDDSLSVAVAFLDLEKGMASTYYMSTQYFNEISKDYIFGDKDNFSIELFADDDEVVYTGDRNIGAKYGKLYFY